MIALLIALSMIMAYPVLADDTPTPWPTETPTPTNSPTRTATPTATGTIPTATATSCPALTFNTDEPIYYPGIPFDEQMIRHIERINVNERNMTECSSDPVEHWMEGIVVQVQTTPPAAPPAGFIRFFQQGTTLYQITSTGTISAIVKSTDTSTLDHNDLNGLQGGTTNEYYHLTAALATAVAANTPTPISTDTPRPTETPMPTQQPTLNPNDTIWDAHYINGVEINPTPTPNPTIGFDEVQYLQYQPGTGKWVYMNYDDIAPLKLVLSPIDTAEFLTGSDDIYQFIWDRSDDKWWIVTPVPTLAPPTPFPTETAIPTETPIPTETAIPTETPIPTDTPLPSTPTPTVTPTGTPHYHVLGTFSNIAELTADGYLYVGYSSQTSATIGIPMPAAGSITGISVSCTTSGYAEGDRIDFECRKNGTNVYEVRIIPDGTGDDSAYAVQAVGTDTFVAGDIIAVNVDLQGTSPKLSKVIVTIWGTW